VVGYPPRGVRDGGTRFNSNRGDPSSGLGPTSEFELRSAAYCHRQHACTLTRFRTPSAQPIHRGSPFPGFAFPGHVASSHLSCASTPYSLVGLPGVLPTRRALGVPPSELYRAEIVSPFGEASPLAIGLPTAVTDTRACLLASAWAPPRNWPS